MKTLSFDLEWNKEAIDVLGLAWEDGLKCSAVERTPATMQQFIDTLHKADRIAGHNAIDADLGQLEKEGFDTSKLLPKVFDTRVALHACYSHLAGTGSFDLRSMVLLLNGRQGKRFPLDWKAYESDLHKTCAYDAAAVSWCVPTLERLIAQNKLEKTVEIGLKCSDIFRRMRLQGVRLDKKVLLRIHAERKAMVEANILKYQLYEERGKKVIKRVPIWRSPKVLDVYHERFGVRPANLQRQTWVKLSANASLSQDARDFASTIVELSKGSNDAHWLGHATAGEDGEIDFEKVNENGFIYPRYDICGSPDRATTASPSIQNWPRIKQDPRVVPIRSAVLPLLPDHRILGIDFASVETITNAVESDDWDRVRATLEKRITHEGTAEIVNKALQLHLDRDQGKVINHGFDKGESPYNLARTLFRTDRPSRQQTSQCHEIFGHMLAEYPKTAQFRDLLWERSRENPLVVTNKFGRRLMCFSRSKYGEANERYAKHTPEKKYWCSCKDCAPRRDRFKYAIAFLGRSSAFDALLRAMAKIWYDRRLDDFSLPMLEVHDELDFSVPVDKAEEYANILKATFEEPIPELGGVCLPAEYKIGENWAKAH